MRRLPAPVVVAGAVIVAVVLFVGVLAPLLAPYDPRAFSGNALERPSSLHLLGTNELGQDLLSQLIWGARTALVVAIVGAAVSTVVGGLVGGTAGLLGGAVDTVAMRVVDAFVAIPGAPLIVLIAALAGPSRLVVVLLIGLLGWPSIAIAVRAQARSLRQRGFVAAAQGFGAGPAYLLRRHLVPGLGPLLVTRFLGWAPVAIFIEAALAGIGLGDPTEPSWARMLSEAISYQGLYFNPQWPLWVLPAGFAITLTVLGFALVGIGMESWFNARIPRRQR